MEPVRAAVPARAARTHGTGRDAAGRRPRSTGDLVRLAALRRTAAGVCRLERLCRLHTGSRPLCAGGRRRRSDSQPRFRARTDRPSRRERVRGRRGAGVADCIGAYARSGQVAGAVVAGEPSRLLAPAGGWARSGSAARRERFDRLPARDPDDRPGRARRSIVRVACWESVEPLSPGGAPRSSPSTRRRQ